jgi:D-arabinose 1-dehydrogenase-like Zn-dependent alcohol dehydrogenase
MYVCILIFGISTCRHEIVGEVTGVGSMVKKIKVGDKVGVGCIVGACHSCENCNNDLEVYCPKMVVSTSALYYDGTITYMEASQTQW